jgi:putative hydrolase of the HAD superfamily
MSFRAVIFDLGGVVIDSPLHAIDRYERERAIPVGFINRVVVDTGPEGAWSRLERGEVGMGAFQRDFEAECLAAGQRISAAEMFERIAECGPRPRMLQAIQTLRASGRAVAALTNNWATEEPSANALQEVFDVFIESSVVGLRKPDPRIYQHVCEALEIAPEEAVFLDDIGRNLKTARTLGMHTIKVEDPEVALAELSRVVGVTFDER